MSRGKVVKPGRLLTPVELEIMTLLWKLGAGSVSDVMEAMPKDRKLAYTSVSTMMRILEQKKFVASDKAGRGHSYRPVVLKEAYETLSLKQLVSQVFDGAPVTLVRRLLDAQTLSLEELKAIRQLLDAKLK